MAQNYPWAVGDELEATDINNVTGVQALVAGETINGTTLPVACFIESADNEVYACDANDATKTEFDGFAISNGTNGNAIDFQTSGIVVGFSGLATGDLYYVQDDKTIGTSPGSSIILIGRAISATQILIIKADTIVLTASDNLRISADVEDSHNGTSFVKVKEVQVNKPGLVRVKFDLRSVVSGDAKAELFVDGVVVETETETGTTYVTYTNDVYISAGSRIALFTRTTTGGANSVGWRNFRIHYDAVLALESTTILDS